MFRRLAHGIAERLWRFELSLHASPSEEAAAAAYPNGLPADRRSRTKPVNESDWGNSRFLVRDEGPMIPVPGVRIRRSNRKPQS
jgi:hypothetical protein